MVPSDFLWYHSKNQLESQRELQRGGWMVALTLPSRVSSVRVGAFLRDLWLRGCENFGQMDSVVSCVDEAGGRGRINM